MRLREGLLIGAYALVLWTLGAGLILSVSRCVGG